jgi:type I site-specific restriction endonuclease
MARIRVKNSLIVPAMPLEDAPAGTGLQQVEEYAEILGLKFAYATNGREILEFDYTTAQERHLSAPGKTFSCPSDGPPIGLNRSRVRHLHA